MNEHTRRAYELLASVEQTLAISRPPRFDVSDWASRRPDDPNQYRAWLAELPDEPAPETEFERWKQESAAKREREDAERKRREAEAAASRAKGKPAARMGYITREMKAPPRSNGRRS